jgi:hypothetical protein
MTFKEQIELYLKDVPSNWRDDLVTLLCTIKDERTKPTCEEVKDCETVTSLSDFSVEDGVVSITYTDEHSVEVTRTFNLEQVINTTLEGIDPLCLTDPATWNTLTYPEKIQLIISNHCDCCGD